MVYLLSLHPCLSPHSSLLLSLDALVSTFCLFVCRDFTFPSVVNNCIATKGGWKKALSHTGMYTHTDTHTKKQQHGKKDGSRQVHKMHNVAHTYPPLSGCKPEKCSLSVCVCVCLSSNRVSKLKTLRAKNHPRSSFFLFFPFSVGPPRDPAYIDNASQTSTTYLPATTLLLLLLPTPSSLHPPPKPHQRHTARQA